jgi:hypothetical protein
MGRKLSNRLRENTTAFEAGDQKLSHGICFGHADFPALYLERENDDRK